MSTVRGAQAVSGEDANLSAHGRRALAIAPESWIRDETEHFVLHFAHGFIGGPVAVEAEFYYRVITAELEIDPAKSPSKQKSHIYIFETAEGWREFIQSASLEEWTGAVSIGNDLFLPRFPEFKFKGNALGHEVAHLLVRRHLGNALPLWLSEGYAEDVSVRAYAAFFRARGYRAKPRTLMVANPMPLAELTQYTVYPAASRVIDFYRQSRQLTRFLQGETTKPQFAKFLRLMAGGEPLESALRTVYGARWLGLAGLERDFQKKYASLLGDGDEE